MQKNIHFTFTQLATQSLEKNHFQREGEGGGLQDFLPALYVL